MIASRFDVTAALAYQRGFGNLFASEALPGALPTQNSPQRCPYGLYSEQISGTAFTAPRNSNRHTWLYRIRPAAAQQSSFAHIDSDRIAGDFSGLMTSPNPLRWAPPPLPETPKDFIGGLATLAGNGDPYEQSGCAIHLYAANRPMTGRAFYDADGELLIVPQQGRLLITTELGLLQVFPGAIAVIPRGVRFRVELPDGTARGYVCESFGAPLGLPDLGPIGSDGLGCARDFEVPVAAYEDLDARCDLIAKFGGELWMAELDRSPFDVVAWRGNHVPYRYDLSRFNAIGSVSYDHPDPSIQLVLRSPADTPGVGEIDFAVFPPRWLAMDHTFRPPWYHRNVASELMGLVEGVYDAKAQGFLPGGASLHNCMTGHGPDARTFERAIEEDTAHPRHLDGGLAFLIESRRVLRPTQAALASPLLQRDYFECWQGLSRRFDPRHP